MNIKINNKVQIKIDGDNIEINTLQETPLPKKQEKQSKYKPKKAKKTKRHNKWTPMRKRMFLRDEKMLTKRAISKKYKIKETNINVYKCQFKK